MCLQGLCISGVSPHLTSLQHQFLLSLKKTCSEQAHLSPSPRYTVKPCSNSGVSLCVGASFVPGIKTPSHFSSQDYSPCLAPSPYGRNRSPGESWGSFSSLGSYSLAMPVHFHKTVALYVLFNVIVHFNGSVSQV